MTAQQRTKDVQVLVVGAGPTGLLLAIYLAKFGVGVRIIDKAAEAGTTSRALVVHARTLELYRQLGLADDVVQHGLVMQAANLWAAGKRVGRLLFGDIGRGLSPYPYALIHPQDEHEQLLIEHLARLGVEVERRTELVALTNEGAGLHATLARDGKQETCEPLYVAGCDGTHSRVRESLGIGFAGGTYEHLFYVADVEASGPVTNNELHVVLDDADFLAVFPLKGAASVPTQATGATRTAGADGVTAQDGGGGGGAAPAARARLVGSIRDAEAQTHKQLAWNDVSTRVIDRMDIHVNTVRWFSTYHVHHRVADRFRAGSVFLLGDAAHIHSPVGGQGMNTGLGDAANLGWKLAAVIAGDADARVLDTYEPERIAFARKLVASTDRAFTYVTKTGEVARRVRVNVIPLLLPPLFLLSMVRRFMFKTVSQIGIHYHGSPLSVGHVGGVRGGDRLPWVQPASSRVQDNHTPLASMDWQVHVYGTASAMIRALCTRHALPLREFPWNVNARRAGLRQNASYLIRPDGYVAVAVPPSRSSALSSFLRTWSVRTRKAKDRIERAAPLAR